MGRRYNGQVWVGGDAAQVGVLNEPRVAIASHQHHGCGLGGASQSGKRGQRSERAGQPESEARHWRCPTPAPPALIATYLLVIGLELVVTVVGPQLRGGAGVVVHLEALQKLVATILVDRHLV